MIQLLEHFTYKKLIRFTIPTVAMMIFTSVYGVVDGLFVSNVAGSESFAGVNLIMPALRCIEPFILTVYTAKALQSMKLQTIQMKLSDLSNSF